MRIRQVRPEFWQDEDVASWPESLRLFYIGLWCVSDDAGYFDYEIGRISALLYPYDAKKRREHRVSEWLGYLEESGKIRRLGSEGIDCRHAVIPTLPVHQKTGGSPSYTVKKDHDGENRTGPDNPVSNVRERNVREWGGTGGSAGAPEGAARGLPFRYEDAVKSA